MILSPTRALKWERSQAQCRPAGDPIVQAPPSGPSAWKIVAVVFGGLAVWELLQYGKYRAMSRRGIQR